MGLFTYTWYLAYDGPHRYDTRHQVFMKNTPCTTRRREPENTPVGQKSWYGLATSVASGRRMLLRARVAVLTDTGTPASCCVVLFSYVCDRGEVVFNVEGGRSCCEPFGISFRHHNGVPSQRKRRSYIGDQCITSDWV